MGSKGKRAKIPNPPAALTKAPRILPPPDVGSSRVRFIFARFDDHDWHESSRQAERTPFESVAAHLKSRELMTWREILTTRRKQDHEVDPSAISTEAQGRLSQRVRDVSGPLWSFRVSGEQRIWGLKLGSEFHVLWWDPHHRVYPSTLRNT